MTPAVLEAEQAHLSDLLEAVQRDYTLIAEHLDSLHPLIPTLYDNGAPFVAYRERASSVKPTRVDFAGDFTNIVGHRTP